MPASFGLSRARIIVAVFFALGLGACASVDEKTVVEGAGVTAPAKEVTSADFIKTNDYCPPIQIRAGTSSLTVYEKGKENTTQYVRYLASITQTARECTMAGDTLTIKVGIAGRVVAGPKGSAASVTLPVRIAVAKQFGGTGPLFSELFKIPVALTAPTFNANYNHVQQVTVTAGPQDRNLVIYVGFDEGPKG